MVFDYYHRLSKSDKAIYDRSDSIGAIRLPDAAGCATALNDIRQCLEKGRRRETEQASQRLARDICGRLRSPSPRVKVLAKRPSDDWGELHGLYEPVEDETRAIITVWMRTAARDQIVAPRTFVRTLLHEICHHLDYEHLGLEDSFHTQGFYKRESSLFKQLNRGDIIPSAARGKKAGGAKAKKPAATARPKKRTQNSTRERVPFPSHLKDLVKPADR